MPMKFIRFFVVCGAVFCSLSAFGQWEIVAPNLIDPKGFNFSGGAMTYSAGRVWAVLTQKIWMSSDDGITWSDRTPPFVFGTPREIDFFDANNGLLSTD